MGRWTQYDEDDYRLPEGMKRIGYDADSGRYYFRDSDGSLWVGPQGAQFGEMTRVNSLPSSIQDEDAAAAAAGSSEVDRRRRRDDDDVEASPRPTRNGGYELLSESDEHSRPMAHTRPANPSTATSPYRTLFPFFLIIAVVLLLIWRLVLAPSFSSPGGATTMKKRCPEGTAARWEFRAVNKGVGCEPLMPGTSVCVPPGDGGRRRRAGRRM
ncbi:hypothetical protein BDZ97DRAFT_1785146 [Flammula alnicola]|nr:hypothetical protein BDZ97DRAFT_1785146 [Flammula alnicola]